MTRHQRRGHSPGDSNDREGELRLKDFLSEYNGLDQANDSKSFYHNFSNNQDLQNVIYRFLVKNRSGDGSDEKDIDLMQRLCHFLHSFYQSVSGAKLLAKGHFIPTSTANDMVRGRGVVLQYLPHFINLHLYSRNWKDKKRYRFVDAFLLSIYNAESAEQQNVAAVTTATTLSSAPNIPTNPLQRPSCIKVPSLSSSSIYHDSGRLESEDKLDQRPSGLVLTFEVFGFVDVLTASTRSKVCQLLMQTFNRCIADVPKSGLEHFTRATLSLLERGYSTAQSATPRFSLDSPVLMELLFSAYVCMYNGFQVAANQIVDLIHLRASLGGCPDVLLLSNSIKSLALTSSPSQVSSTHVSTPVQLAKNMITNASFRAKKMQMDIPKVQVEAAPDEGNTSTTSVAGKPNLVSMTSIVEEDGAKTPTKSEATKVFNPDKLIAKLRKKTISDERGIGSSSEAPLLKAKASFERKDKRENQKSDKKKTKERPEKLEMSSHNEPPPLILSSINGDSASAAPSNSSSQEPDTEEKVAELIKKNNLPAETITIHSPESGTTIF